MKKFFVAALCCFPMVVSGETVSYGSSKFTIKPEPVTVYGQMAKKVIAKELSFDAAAFRAEFAKLLHQKTKK